jgi:ATP adenylyltransferase
MKYVEYLAQLPEHFCPFCEAAERVISEQSLSFLTYARAPYQKHHLLVVPKRHVEHFLDLSRGELSSIEYGIREAFSLLHELGYHDISVLVRDGKVGDVRSVAHVHYHVIPEHHIGDLDIDGKERTVLEGEDIVLLLDELRKHLPKYKNHL